MKVFDFDNTIYDGESSIDFFLFCLTKKPSLIKYLPLVIKMAILYKLKKLPLNKLTEVAYKVMNIVIENEANYEKFIKEFWRINKKKLRLDFLKMIKNEDVIISATPKLLLNGISDYFNTSNIYGTEFDFKNKESLYICYGENKLTLLKEKYPDLHIDEVYTDSYSDLPLINQADKAYIVNKKGIKKHK